MSSLIRYFMGKVGESLKIYLSVIVDNSKVSNFKGKVYNSATMSKREFAGGSMYDITIFPYITIDFTSYEDKLEAKLEGVHTYVNSKIKLNRYNLYLFVGLLKKMEQDFVTNKSLYYYSNGNLILNKEIANEISIKTQLGEVIIMMYPAVITVGGGEKEHEGICLAVNDLSNGVYLTYTEMGYLRYILSKTDIDTTAIDLIKLVGEDKITKIIGNSVISIDSANNITVKQEEQDNSSYNTIKSENVIPNL